MPTRHRTCAGQVLRLAALACLTVTAAKAEGIALPGDATFPESITSTADGTLFVSSFASGGVIRIKPGAQQGEAWIKPGAFGTRSTFGLLADESSGTLWVCSNDITAMGVKSPGEEKGSALKGFDLKTGEGKVSAAFAGERNLCNDIAVGPDGSAYVTNTFAPQILRLKPGSQTLEVWASDPLFELDDKEAGLDGIAFGTDGNLYVNTFTKAKLFRIEVTDGKAGKVTPLKPSQPLVLSDAIRPLGDGSFLIVEGGGRLDRMTVTGDEAKIEVLQDGFAGGLTGVTRVGDKAFVSEGFLALLTDPSKKGSKPPLPFRIHEVRLKAP